MWRPFIELNVASDEWSGEAIGLFIGHFCLLGVNVRAGYVGLIVFNIAIGVYDAGDDS